MTAFDREAYHRRKASKQAYDAQHPGRFRPVRSYSDLDKKVLRAGGRAGARTGAEDGTAGRPMRVIAKSKYETPRQALYRRAYNKITYEVYRQNRKTRDNSFRAARGARVFGDGPSDAKVQRALGRRAK